MGNSSFGNFLRRPKKNNWMFCFCPVAGILGAYLAFWGFLHQLTCLLNQVFESNGLREAWVCFNQVISKICRVWTNTGDRLTTLGWLSEEGKVCFLTRSSHAQGWFPHAGETQWWYSMKHIFSSLGTAGISCHSWHFCEAIKAGSTSISE